MLEIFKDELNWVPSVAYLIAVVFLMLFLWYAEANWPTYREVINYYLIGCILFFSLVGLSAIFDEYLDVIIFKKWSLSLPILIPVSLVIAVLFINIPLQFVGIPFFGTSPLNFVPLDVQVKTIRLVASVVETSIWSGFLFPTIVKLTLILLFSLYFVGKMGSEYFKAPYSHIRQWKEEHAVAFYAILIPVVFLSAFLTANIVSRWHEYAYTAYCVEKNIPKEKCIVTFERVRDFQFISDLLTYGTGSVLPGVIIHFINNFVAV
jgi:hypothetical protein